MAIKKDSDGEPRRILNVMPSRDIEHDWQSIHAFEAGVLKKAPPPPTSKDLRASWWGVDDQLSSGACVGFAVAGSALRWHFVNAALLPNNVLLSARFQWIAAKETDVWQTPPTTFIEAEGTSVKAALDVARRYGAVPDSLVPFGSGAL